MPPPKIPKPEFSPLGRYILDVRERWYQEIKPVFHDTTNYQEECHIELIPTGSVSRFENASWADKRGLNRCSHCMPGKMNS